MILALAYLGYAPVGLASFEAALVSLQALLSGEEIGFEQSGECGGGAASHDTLSLAGRPEGVRLRWLPEGVPKVPLDVAATGPKVIAMAARIAERVTFSVGAEVERIAWAMDVARTAREAAGLPGEGVSYGAQLVVVCHPDDETAMEVAMHMAPPFVRFQVIQGTAVGPHDAEAAASLDAVRSGYDMTEHGNIGSKERIKDGALSPDFVRRFTIVGPPDRCIERLLALRAAGLDRFVVVGPGFYPAEWGAAASLFAREVIPALRAAGEAERATHRIFRQHEGDEDA